MSSSQNYSENDRKHSSNWETSSLFESMSSYHRDFEAMPSYCACGGVRAVLQTTRMQEHYGLCFWGCRFYKKEMIIMKQKMEMESINKDLDSIKKDLDFVQKDLESSKGWIKILVVICIYSPQEDGFI
ncbi:hypothetical protein RIF29_29941 [Crotalaria pallida]|uniref:Uncharacterized protein n=1 Tax=Crotalaria pallida TaxID=3830 RepID=A0AAN9EHK1_CROPI